MVNLRACPRHVTGRVAAPHTWLCERHTLLQAKGGRSCRARPTSHDRHRSFGSARGVSARDGAAVREGSALRCVRLSMTLLGDHMKNATAAVIARGPAAEVIDGAKSKSLVRERPRWLMVVLLAGAIGCPAAGGDDDGSPPKKRMTYVKRARRQSKSSPGRTTSLCSTTAPSAFASPSRAAFPTAPSSARATPSAVTSPARTSSRSGLLRVATMKTRRSRGPGARTRRAATTPRARNRRRACPRAVASLGGIASRDPAAARASKPSAIASAPDDEGPQATMMA